MIVAIDSGNTSAKIGVFINGNLESVTNFEDYSEVIAHTKSLDPEKVLISSVKFPVNKFREDLNWYSTLILTDKTPLPFKMKYQSPATLGVDRIALVAGAHQRFNGKNALIIGAGTCITYDFINENGEYLGGGISPGLDMRFNALHQFTENLPRVTYAPEPDLIGTTTEKCISSGVVHGINSEINGIIRLYREKYTELSVVLSGGNVKFFESTLKDRIFALPNLVLLGLYTILLHNES